MSGSTNSSIKNNRFIRKVRSFFGRGKENDTKGSVAAAIVTVPKETDLRETEPKISTPVVIDQLNKDSESIHSDTVSVRSFGSEIINGVRRSFSKVSVGLARSTTPIDRESTQDPNLLEAPSSSLVPLSVESIHVKDPAEDLPQISPINSSRWSFERELPWLDPSERPSDMTTSTVPAIEWMPSLVPPSQLPLFGPNSTDAGQPWSALSSTTTLACPTTLSPTPRAPSATEIEYEISQLQGSTRAKHSDVDEDDAPSDTASEASIDLDLPSLPPPSIRKAIDPPMVDIRHPLTLPRSFGRRKSVGSPTSSLLFPHSTSTMSPLSPSTLTGSGETWPHHTRSYSDSTISDYQTWISNGPLETENLAITMKRSKSFVERSIVITADNINEILGNEDDISGNPPTDDISTTDINLDYTGLNQSRRLRVIKGNSDDAGGDDFMAPPSDEIMVGQAEPISTRTTAIGPFTQRKSMDEAPSDQVSLKRSKSVKSQYNDIADGIPPEVAGPTLPPRNYLDLIEAMYSPPETLAPMFPPETQVRTTSSAPSVEPMVREFDMSKTQEQLDVITLYSNTSIVVPAEPRKSSSLGQTVQTARDDEDASSVCSESSTASDLSLEDVGQKDQQHRLDVKKSMDTSELSIAPPPSPSLSRSSDSMSIDTSSISSTASRTKKLAKKMKRGFSWVSNLFTSKSSSSSSMETSSSTDVPPSPSPPRSSLSSFRSRTSKDISKSKSIPPHSTMQPVVPPEAELQDQQVVLGDLDSDSEFVYPVFNNPHEFEFGGYARFSLSVEKAVYSLSHLKLSEQHRPLVQQVAISNLMLYILSVHADVTLKRRGPRGRRKKKKKAPRGARRRRGKVEGGLNGEYVPESVGNGSANPYARNFDPIYPTSEEHSIEENDELDAPMDTLEPQVQQQQPHSEQFTHSLPSTQHATSQLHVPSDSEQRLSLEGQRSISPQRSKHTQHIHHRNLHNQASPQSHPPKKVIPPKPLLSFDEADLARMHLQRVSMEVDGSDGVNTGTSSNGDSGSESEDLYTRRSSFDLLKKKLMGKEYGLKRKSMDKMREDKHGGGGRGERGSLSIDLEERKRYSNSMESSVLSAIFTRLEHQQDELPNVNDVNDGQGHDDGNRNTDNQDEKEDEIPLAMLKENGEAY
jgi:hypothetical protein